jgi:hypothetical protein
MSGQPFLRMEAARQRFAPPFCPAVTGRTWNIEVSQSLFEPVISARLLE